MLSYNDAVIILLIFLFCIHLYFIEMMIMSPSVIHDCVMCFLLLSHLLFSSIDNIALLFRHKINNYFLIAYRHFWLGKMHERADYDSLLSMLTVM